MNTLSQSLLVALGALALAGTAFAQEPSSNDTSDVNQNTGMGTGALVGGPNPVLLTGAYNTGSGYFVLTENTSGSYNTAIGALALEDNGTGNNNTATGYEALLFNIAGSGNTAAGYEALYGNTDTEPSGSNNTGIGANALYSYSTGSDNVASGVNALYADTTGMYNTATGTGALVKNMTGNYNVAEGAHAGGALTSGSGNIAVGYEAGLKLTTGSNNIHIGSPGVAADDGVIRIGTITGTTSTQSATYIAGIYKVTITSGLPVVIDSKGQIGTTSSSERFKTAIEPMGANTARLQRLRPVTFHYKADPGTMRYGLIAEEVAKVYPELVVRDDSGRIDGVRYDELAPMLLNEVQQQHTQMTGKIAAQAAEIRDLKAQMADLKDLKAELHAALLKLGTEDKFAAQR